MTGQAERRTGIRRETSRKRLTLTMTLKSQEKEEEEMEILNQGEARVNQKYDSTIQLRSRSPQNPQFPSYPFLFHPFLPLACL